MSASPPRGQETRSPASSVASWRAARRRSRRRCGACISTARPATGCPPPTPTSPSSPGSCWPRSRRFWRRWRADLGGEVRHDGVEHREALARDDEALARTAGDEAVALEVADAPGVEFPAREGGVAPRIDAFLEPEPHDEELVALGLG